MAQSGRTPRTKTCQAEHSCLPKPKLHPLTASITAGVQGVTLSCLGWGEQSCGLAPGAARAPSSPCCWSLPALTWSPSSSATKTSVHTCARSQLLTCTYRCIYAHPPPRTWLTRSQLSTEGLLLEKLPKEKIIMCSSLCYFSPWNIGLWCLFFFNSRRLSSYFLVSLSIVFSLS